MELTSEFKDKGVDQIKWIMVTDASHVIDEVSSLVPGLIASDIEHKTEQE